MLIHGSHKAKIHTYASKLKYTHSHALTLTREENANKYIFNVTRQPGGVEFKYFTTFIYIFKKKISSSRLYKQFSLRQPLSQVAAGSHQTETRASRPSHRLCGLVARLRRLGFRWSGGGGAGWRCCYTSAAESLAGSCAPTTTKNIHLAYNPPRDNIRSLSYSSPSTCDDGAPARLPVRTHCPPTPPRPNRTPCAAAAPSSPSSRSAGDASAR